MAIVVHVGLWLAPSAAARRVPLPAGEVDLLPAEPPDEVARPKARRGIVVVGRPGPRTVMRGLGGALGRANPTGYACADLNGLIAALGETFAPAHRQALIDQAAAMLRADAIDLPLHHEVLTLAHRNRIRVVQRPMA